MSEPNRAIVPEPVPPTPKQYRVRGPQKVLGHEPGETFEAVIPPDQEARLVRVGHIRPVVIERPNEHHHQTQEG